MASGDAMSAKVWATQEDGSKLYVPSKDGRFEKWLDREYPEWTAEPTDTITFYRELWAAAIETEVL